MKLLNKTVITLLMIITFLTGFSVTSNASIKGKITADNIRLRSQANTDSKIITLVSINEEVDVLEKEGQWYKIEYKGKTGYIKSEFIKLQDDSATENNNQTIEEESVAKETTAQTSKEQVAGTSKIVEAEEKLYILPLINSKVVDTIGPNTKLEILQVANGWSYITTNQVSGWIRADKLVEKKEESKKTETEIVKQQQEPEEIPTEKEVNKTGYIKSDNVNFRKEANKSAKVLDRLEINTEIKVLTELDDWYKIKVDNVTGYVAKELVSFKKVEVSSRSEDEPRQEVKEETKEQNQAPTDTNVSDLGQKIANYAQGFVGYPYVYGGSTPSGFDCSGFTSYIYKQFGYTISRSSSAQASNGKQVAKSDLQPGDLVLFKGVNSSSIGHVGIYIGGNQFVHASTQKTGVKISSLSAGSYIQRYVTARRII